MTSFSFAHVADLHLDTPFSGLASLNDDLAMRLNNASLDAWERVVQAALHHGVDFVVIAGDVYDSDTASVRAQPRFKRGLERLSAAGIPVPCSQKPARVRWRSYMYEQLSRPELHELHQAFSPTSGRPLSWHPAEGCSESGCSPARERLEQRLAFAFLAGSDQAA